MRYIFTITFSTVIAISVFAELAPPHNLQIQQLYNGIVSIIWIQESTTGLEENFEDSTAQSFVFYTPHYSDFIVGNGYLESQADISGWILMNSFYYSASYYHNYTLEVEIENVEFFNVRGIIFHSLGPVDEYYTGYGFWYGFHPGDGPEYTVVKYYEGTWSYAVYWSETDLVNTNDGEINVLKVISFENVFDLYINDTYVNSFEEDFLSWGYVGLVNGDGNTVRFNEISCTRDAQLMDRSVEPRRGHVVEEWLDPAGNPTDQPPRMSGWPWDDPQTHDRRSESESLHSAQDDAQRRICVGNPLDEFVEYRVYRNGTLIGTTEDTVFTDQLPQYGTYDYHVTAYYDPEGESIPSVTKTVTWNAVTYSIAERNIIVPASGGTITYAAQLFNELPFTFANVTYQTFIAEPPFYSVVHGPLLQRTFTLAPGQSIYIPEMTQTIPADAGPGMYLFTGRLLYNGNIAREQSFYFHKMSGGE